MSTNKSEYKLIINELIKEINKNEKSFNELIDFNRSNLKEYENHDDFIMELILSINDNCINYYKKFKINKEQFNKYKESLDEHLFKIFLKLDLNNETTFLKVIENDLLLSYLKKIDNKTIKLNEVIQKVFEKTKNKNKDKIILFKLIFLNKELIKKMNFSETLELISPKLKITDLLLLFRNTNLKIKDAQSFNKTDAKNLLNISSGYDMLVIDEFLKLFKNNILKKYLANALNEILTEKPIFLSSKTKIINLFHENEILRNDVLGLLMNKKLIDSNIINYIVQIKMNFENLSVEQLNNLNTNINLNIQKSKNIKYIYNINYLPLYNKTNEIITIIKQKKEMEDILIENKENNQKKVHKL